MGKDKKRVIMIGLDGYESSIGNRLMDEGRMPHLAALRKKSARWLLEHGEYRNTGLAWEQVSSGLAPDRSDRWSAVVLDPETYKVRQQGAVNQPFASHIDAKTLVLDAPYFDLAAAPNCIGAVNWGATDPGVAPYCRPASLFEEIRERFGPYKGKEFIYAFLWPDAEKTRLAGQGLAAGVDQRTEVMQWLMTERLPDWDLAITVISELHAAIEPMWHGMDPTHPLHNHPSAPEAKRALEGVYEALDRHVGAVQAAAPDATVVCFAMHGMGENDADVAGMVLLPEILYRMETGKTLYTAPREWTELEDGIPILPPHTPWDRAILNAMRGGRALRARRKIKRGFRSLYRRLRPEPMTEGDPVQRNSGELYVPAVCYSHAWPEMRAFGFPAFYDGRIRINLEGREARGRVPVTQYAEVVDELVAMLRSLKDPRTGMPAVNEIQTPVADDPLSAHPTQSDITMSFVGTPAALEHPELGIIGPAPFRRVGGHTGPYGVLYISDVNVVAGDHGVRSSFDVVPTIARLLGDEACVAYSGEPVNVPRYAMAG
ncbi:hypothetical protein [Novosphingobium malaysiense]|uniref:hypothetical protein n=1 Tax=Novosphingobium malaysiense TaxID=1348853 RepID=UPI00068A4E43|nr:hypothetical protein [Novosphingobium malaysiense]